MIAYSLQEARSIGPLLKQLVLDRQGLTSIPEEVQNYKSVETLDLSHNQIHELPSWLGVFERLHTLRLDHNQLQQFKHTLASLQQLKVLGARDNQLSSIDLEELPPNLVELELSHNQIKSFAGQKKLLQLSRLDLSKNNLTAFPSLALTPNIKVLKLGNNNIRSFPAELPMNAIQHLDLHKNPLQEIGPSLGAFHQVHHLNLQQTKIEVLPPEIGRCSYIRSLLLDKNKLTNLPETLGQLKWLAELGLSQNQFIAFPEIIKQLPRLAHLDLSKNQLAGLPDLRTMLAIRKLDISANPLFYILHLPPHLQILRMRRTSINIFLFLIQLPQLKQLDLGQQQWKSLPGSIYRLRQLEVLKGGLPYREKKRLLTFLKALYNTQIQGPEARLLFDFWQKESACGLQILLQGLNMPIQSLQEKIKAHILSKEAIPAQENSVSLFGKVAPKWIQQLEQNGLSISSNSTNIILGKAPYHFPKRDYTNTSFYTVAQLASFLQKRGTSPTPTINKRQQNKLIKLLLHPNPVQVRKALLLLPKSPAEASLQVALLLAWKLQAAGPLKQTLRKIITEKVSPPFDQFSSLSLSPNDRSTPTLLQEKLNTWLSNIGIESTQVTNLLDILIPK